jgi:hypothetical protein
MMVGCDSPSATLVRDEFMRGVEANIAAARALLYPSLPRMPSPMSASPPFEASSHDDELLPGSLVSTYETVAKVGTTASSDDVTSDTFLTIGDAEVARRANVDTRSADLTRVIFDALTLDFALRPYMHMLAARV